MVLVLSSGSGAAWVRILDSRGFICTVRSFFWQMRAKSISWYIRSARAVGCDCCEKSLNGLVSVPAPSEMICLPGVLGPFPPSPPPEMNESMSKSSALVLAYVPADCQNLDFPSQVYEKVATGTLPITGFGLPLLIMGRRLGGGPSAACTKNRAYGSSR
jgi:hypothetical protein